MSENVEKKLHRNRKYSIPTMGDGGPLNSFSRTDFLKGISPCHFGSDQHPDIFVKDARSINDQDPTPLLWPKLWPNQGRLLNVPKCVIISEFICWPEFWEKCEVDFPRDVIGILLTTGDLGNYYYLDQWDRDKDWKTGSEIQFKELDYRYAKTILKLQNPYYVRHKKFCKAMESVKNQLESDPNDPIHVIFPEWIPSNKFELERGHSTKVGNEWAGWALDTRYWSGQSASEVTPNVLGRYTNCDAGDGQNGRGRTHQDPDCPNWHSKANVTPDVPCLLSKTPYFGTNVLHIWLGHWCLNRIGGSGGTNFETYALSPAGVQIASVILSSYLGATIPFFDGRRAVWRDLGLNFGYMEGFEGVYNFYSGSVEGAANNFKENFYKYRNFGVRIFPFPKDEWKFPWAVSEIEKDKKWCPAQGFYFGFTFDEWAAAASSEDSYAVDFSQNYDGLKMSNVVTRFPDSPSVRRAESAFFLPLKTRFEKYYKSIDPGTRQFYEKMIADNNLNEYNVELGKEDEFPEGDDLVSYIRGYFAAHP